MSLKRCIKLSIPLTSVHLCEGGPTKTVLSDITVWGYLDGYWYLLVLCFIIYFIVLWLFINPYLLNHKRPSPVFVSPFRSIICWLAYLPLVVGSYLLSGARSALFTQTSQSELLPCKRHCWECPWFLLCKAFLWDI